MSFGKIRVRLVLVLMWWFWGSTVSPFSRRLHRLRLAVFCSLPLFTLASAQRSAQGNRQSLPLPSSKMLSLPSPGRIGDTNSFPATMAVSPDGRYAALLNDGYGTQETLAQQSIAILDLKNNHIFDYPDSRLRDESHQSYFIGLAFSSDGKRLYASVGSVTDPRGERAGDLGNGIAMYSFSRGKVTADRFIPIAPQPIAPGKKAAIALQKTPRQTAIPYPAGLAVISPGSTTGNANPGSGDDQLLVADNLSDNVVLLDTGGGKVLQRFDLSTNDLIPSSFPYTVVAARDGRRAWCSLWNASQVDQLDLSTGEVVRRIKLLEPQDPIAPGSHPTALLLSPDEKILYVALSNADLIAAILVSDGRPIHYLSTNAPAQKFAGSQPTALAQSSDGKFLFAADSALDAVAVFDTSALDPAASGDPGNPQTALGFIPTDWYPSALAVHGDDLFIATAKGKGSGPNIAMGKTASEKKHHSHAYIPTLLRGSIARLNIRFSLSKLDELTRTVEQDNLLDSDPGKIQFAQGSNPIHHVIYVIKENRTYDQVLGDLKVGNGDASLTLYGWDITPNQHQLALQFGVLDDFYDSGEVSGDGHDWSTAAITSDYNEKTWQINYRNKERTYDYRGTVAGEFPLEQGEPDIDAPSTGYIWYNLARHNVTYRDYGEFVDTTWCKAAGALSGAETCERATVNRGEPLPSNVGQPHRSASPWPWAVPMIKRTKPTKAALRDHFDPNFPDFDTDYPDQLRADEFLNEFEGFVRARNLGTGTELPGFVLLYLPDDHTGGTRAGKSRPAASVADNDLALGRVVEAVSHSPYWDDTAIFVVEDDAQNGADHVDAHRSIAFVVSKYSPGSTA